ncbi:IdeS/Mac family cysteine endopeptidase [uncultured Bacteroides sp.]|uniref:fimbrillin family protein n=1 Tax=uncultured Bacteroides sp. TaxID=162156 RepID=UPI00262C6878|nr:IdeS/Mac family cysteine endopeptidase [uncultured Bacteroides sp.]
MTVNLKNHILLIVFSFLFGISCTSDYNLSSDSNAELIIECNRSLSWIEGRAVTEEDGSGNFVDGDRIEMLIKSGVVNKTFMPEYKEGRWTPSLNRGDYSSDKINVSAIYPILPFTDEGNFLRTISLPIDQSNVENHKSGDILYANTVAGLSDSYIRLQFSHAMHRICINLKGNVPEDLQVELLSVTDGYISLENGTVAGFESSVPQWMRPFKKGENSYMAIILPQDATSYHSDEGFIKLTSGGKTVHYTLDEGINSFNQGMQTTINLTLKSAETGDVDTEFSNQTRWVYGVNAPDFPGKENVKTYNVGKYDVEEGIWLRYAYENMYPPMLNESQYLTWKEGCGWYDCNKSFEYEGDRNMCWAASASNLIHWWLEHNRKYIEAYDKRFGQDHANMKRPEKYTKMTKENQHHSEVFNFFKSSFRDKGSWDTGGVNWYINGDRKNLSPDILNFNGFFSGVFTKDDKVAEEIKNMSKENFNKSMKDAFKNNKAIGFTSYDFAGKYTGVHALTIWGAEFDADGNVEYVYFCDNNSSDIEPNHASLQRYKVVYVESTIPEIKGLIANLRALDNNDGSIPTLLHPFSSLTLVDLRQDVWQRAFPRIE